MSTILLSTLALAIFYVVLVWLLSLKMGRCGIIDAFWGPGFVLIAWLAFLSSDVASSDRLDLMFLLEDIPKGSVKPEECFNVSFLPAAAAAP